MSPAKCVVVMVFGCVALWSQGTRAQECMEDANCPRGFTCQVTGRSTCASAPTPAFPACPPESKSCGRPAPNPAPAPDCAPQEYRSCAPAACTTDADCADGMVCHAQNLGVCTSGAALPCEGGICPPRPEPTCTDNIVRSCVPRYLLPCTDASSCGPGFSCEPQMNCGCAGSAPAPAPVPTPSQDAGVDALPAPAPPVDRDPPTCGCQPTAEKYCKQLDITCKADSDCPSMWTCRASAVTQPGRACMDVPGADGGTCGSADRAFVPPPAPEKRCAPPYDGLNVGVVGGDGRSEPGTGGTGTTTGAPGKPPVATSPTPAPQQPNGAPESAEEPASTHVKACSVRAPGENTSFGGWVSLLSLLAAGLFVARRRR